MVKSSRGNPYRYPKGAPNGRGGQFAPKGTGVKEEKSDEYYEDRTLDRTPMGILKESLKRVKEKEREESQAALEYQRAKNAHWEAHCDRVRAESMAIQIDNLRNIAENSSYEEARENARKDIALAESLPELKEKEAELEKTRKEYQLKLIKVKDPKTKEKELRIKRAIARKELAKIPKKQFTREQALEVNPDWEGQGNCQCCVPACEMRRRGYDVTARKAMVLSIARNPSLVWAGAEVVETEKTGVSEIRKSMKGWGEGARCQISVQWKKEMARHTFMAEQVDGKTMFYDPQTGKDASAYFRHAMLGKTKFWRIDNLEPTSDILSCFA